ncbi:LOW QUALITY PROTEIN: hypothetical protein BC937DRAFT_95197, partial [Endogone sp. FLAS-F59071]
QNHSVYALQYSTVTSFNKVNAQKRPPQNDETPLQNGEMEEKQSPQENGEMEEKSSLQGVTQYQPKGVVMIERLTMVDVVGENMTLTQKALKAICCCLLNQGFLLCRCLLNQGFLLLYRKALVEKTAAEKEVEVDSHSGVLASHCHGRCLSNTAVAVDRNGEDILFHTLGIVKVVAVCFHLWDPIDISAFGECDHTYTGVQHKSADTSPEIVVRNYCGEFGTEELSVKFINTLATSRKGMG